MTVLYGIERDSYTQSHLRPPIKPFSADYRAISATARHTREAKRLYDQITEDLPSLLSGMRPFIEAVWKPFSLSPLGDKAIRAREKASPSLNVLIVLSPYGEPF